MRPKIYLLILFSSIALFDVRASQNQTDQEQKGSWPTKTRKDTCDWGGQEKGIAFDESGVVRYYVVEGGTGDSRVSERYFYHDGKLRFALFYGGATNGTKLEKSVFLDEMGKIIAERDNKVNGPGYNFEFQDARWLKRRLNLKAKEDFEIKLKCK